MANVKLAWIKKYGEEEGLKKWEERKKLSANTLENYIKKHGKELGTVKYNTLQEKFKYRFTLPWFIEKYGDINGTIKYTENCSKLSVSIGALTKRGFNSEEIMEIKHRHSTNSKNNLETFIKRYGEQEGRIRYDNYKKTIRSVSKRSLEYWIKKSNGNLELAKRLLSNYQRRDLSWFISTFGSAHGHQKYQDANKKRGRTLENYINKYGCEIGKEKYIAACKNFKDNQSGIFNSKGQLELEQYLKDIYCNVKGSRNETGIILTEPERCVVKNNILYPDIIVNDAYIINYNGDFWHCRSTIFKDELQIHPRIKKTIKEIRDIDIQKNIIYKNRGFITIDIWDSDYWTNKDKIKNMLKELIQ